MWIARSLEPKIKHSVRTRPVLVLTGARQTGKTSALLRLFPDMTFVSLDLPTEAEQAEKEPRAFLQRHPPPVIIDEVQYAPGLFRHLKAEVDGKRAANGQFLHRIAKIHAHEERLRVARWPRRHHGAGDAFFRRDSRCASRH